MILQTNGLLKYDILVKALSQVSQTYGLLPVCVASYLNNLDLLAKAFSHFSQTCGFVPVCLLLSAVKYDFMAKALFCKCFTNIWLAGCGNWTEKQKPCRTFGKHKAFHLSELNQTRGKTTVPTCGPSPTFCSIRRFNFVLSAKVFPHSWHHPPCRSYCDPTRSHDSRNDADMFCRRVGPCRRGAVR